jgi:hypothetical protein
VGVVRGLSLGCPWPVGDWRAGVVVGCGLGIDWWVEGVTEAGGPGVDLDVVTGGCVVTREIGGKGCTRPLTGGTRTGSGEGCTYSSATCVSANSGDGDRCSVTCGRTCSWVVVDSGVGSDVLQCSLLGGDAVGRVVLSACRLAKMHMAVGGVELGTSSSRSCT